MVAVQIRHVARRHDPLPHRGRVRVGAVEEGAELERDGLLLLGEEDLAQRLAQKGQDAVVDEEEVEGWLVGL